MRFRSIWLSTALVLFTLLARCQSDCDNTDLGLHSRLCQQCGSPGLDDFCVKKFGACGNYLQSFAPMNNFYTGSSGLLPPVGYLSTDDIPTTCTAMITAAQAVPLRGGGTGITVYREAGVYGNTVPRISFNDALVPYLLEVRRTSNCLENNSLWPNWVWNTNNGYNVDYYKTRAYGTVWDRTDSFIFNDNGNNTWSYQCYCDFCNACQSCTNG